MSCQPIGAPEGLGDCEHRFSLQARVLHEAQELLTTGHITFPRPEAGLLLRVRKGELAYAEVSQIIEGRMAQLDEWVKESKLPEEPDREKAEQLIIGVYGTAVLDLPPESFYYAVPPLTTRDLLIRLTNLTRA